MFTSSSGMPTPAHLTTWASLNAAKALWLISNVTLMSVIFESAIEIWMQILGHPWMEISGHSTALCFIFVTCIGFPHQAPKNRHKKRRERQFSGEWEGGRGEKRRMSKWETSPLLLLRPLFWSWSITKTLNVESFITLPVAKPFVVCESKLKPEFSESSRNWMKPD